MASAPVIVPVPDIKYLNCLINCIDPCKDAMIKFTTKNKEVKELTEIEHGNFLKNEILIPMFNNPRTLNDKDTNMIKGVGDEKIYLKNIISSALKINEIPQQEIIRLKFSPTKDLRLDEELYLTYDAGPGPDNFCKKYKLVLTPGSVIDSARKGKTHNNQENILSKDNTLSKSIINEFNLCESLTGIEFKTNTKTNTNYKFNIKTTIPGFEDITIMFNRNTFDEFGTKYCAGNPKKNEYIFNNWNLKNNINKIKYLVLMKELGDTLQVAWLKDIISKNNLIISKTAICTCDTTVWLRSVLNGVSCIYTNVNRSIFYPIGSIEGLELIRYQNERKLEVNNTTVINYLRIFKLYIDDKTNNDLDFHNKKLSDENKMFMSNILSKVIEALVIINDNILQKIKDINENKKHSEFVAKNLFKSPFRIFGTRDIEHFSTFTHFINVDGNKEYAFNVNLIYRLLYYNDSVTETQIIGEDLRKIINLPSRKRVTNGGSNNSKKINTSNNNIQKDIVEKNINNPGFLSYYTIMYLPEVIYIIYSISYVYNLPEKEIYTYLFKSNNIIGITESFGELNKIDNIHEYIPKLDNQNLVYADTLFVNIYQYLVYFKEKSIAKTHNIFNLCYDEINWMLDFIKRNKGIYDYNINITSENQSKILDVYQELYDSEVYLTILNKREEKSPVDLFLGSLSNPASPSVIRSSSPVQTTPNRSKNRTLNKRKYTELRNNKNNRTLKKRKYTELGNNNNHMKYTNTPRYQGNDVLAA